MAKRTNRGDLLKPIAYIPEPTEEPRFFDPMAGLVTKEQILNPNA